MLAGRKGTSLQTIQDVQQPVMRHWLKSPYLGNPAHNFLPLCLSVCPSVAQVSPSYRRPSPTLLEPTSSARWHTRWGGREGNCSYLTLCPTLFLWWCDICFRSYKWVFSGFSVCDAAVIEALTVQGFFIMSLNFVFLALKWLLLLFLFTAKQLSLMLKKNKVTNCTKEHGRVF